MIYLRGKGIIDIYILEILARCSSEEHRLRQTDIMKYLDRDYNLTIGRNTLSGYIRELKREHYIEGDRGVYYVRKFTNSEIRIMINNIIYSKEIPQQDIRDIVNKLRDMADPEYRKKLNNIYLSDCINRTANNNITQNIELIEKAIDKCRKIEIEICNYNLNGKLVVSGKRIVNPYYIVVEKSRYYLLCYAERQDIEPRRIDRIKTVKLLNEKRLEINEIDKYKNNTFQISSYMRKQIYMYSEDDRRIILKIKIKNIGDFIDWYGMDYKIIESGEEEAILSIEANVNAVYFWALQYGEIAEILEPIELRDKIIDGLESMLKKYKIKKT